MFAGHAWRWTVVAAALALAGACAPAGTAGGPDAGTPGGGSTPSGGDAGTPDAGTTATKAPVLTGGTARVTGRTGGDVLLSLTGTDPDGNAQLLGVRFLDASGQPVPVFDQDLDGVPESAEGPASYNETLTAKTSFTVTAPFTNLVAEQPRVARVVATLRDAKGNTSAPLELALQAQPVKYLNDACDKTYVLDRCGPELGCKGSPAVCSPPEAPTTVRAAFLRDELGPRILVEGLDPDDDMGRVRLDYYDSAGSAVSLDLDNDGVPESNGQDADSFVALGGGKWVLKVQSGEGFDQVVQRIVATPIDGGNRRGAAVTANLADPAVRSLGQSCSPYGFDECTTAGVCTPNSTASAYSCVSATTVRSQQCTAAPLLGPSTGVYTAAGKADGTSLWEVPSGCANGDPTGRPEGVAMLRLPRAVQRVTVTTDLPGTTFDTVLHVYKGCTNTSALACADDALDGSSQGSTVTLDNLAAGDYLLVVDSWSFEGGTWELAVDVVE